MQKLNIRLATVSDAKILAHHRTGMWLAMGDLLPESAPEMLKVSEAYFIEAVASKEYIGWLAETPDKTVIAGGGLTLRKNAPFPDANKKTVDTSYSAHVFNVFVEHEYRGRGIARQIMETIHQWAIENNIKTLTLNASPQGQPLYESLGYTTGSAHSAMKINL